MTERMGSRRRVLALGLGSAAIVAMGGVYASFGLGGASRAGAEESGSKESGRPPLRGAMQHFVLQPTPASVPEIRFQDREQHDRSLADFRGRLVLLNFWATWCGPCVEEMPSLVQLQSALGSEKFTVLALSQDRAGLPLVEQFYREHQLRGLDMFVDRTSSAGRSFHLRGLPTSVLLDADGRELGRLEGAADWSGPDALALIRHYLPKPASSPTTAT